VRAALAAVESGTVDAGFVYKTMRTPEKVEIAFSVPIDKGPAIRYPVAIVKRLKQARQRTFFAICNRTTRENYSSDTDSL
jgi:ABC-type molybdate transport system substrate-binding protein